jgi:tRNA A-37 threonylcarbamoyl transferase component Bud32
LGLLKSLRRGLRRRLIVFMSEFPFSVTIKPTRADDEIQSVTCVGLLRSVGGRQQVYDGLWGGRPVALKFFGDRFKAEYRMSREWRALEMLRERGLSCPAPLLRGRSDRLGWAVVTEKISDAEDLREVWQSTSNTKDRLELLGRVGRELAKQHSKGVLQRDLHLGSFLVQDKKLFALELANVRFLSAQVDKKGAINQLALLGSSVAGMDANMLAELYKEYAQMRSWEFSSSDMAVLTKGLAAYETRRIRRMLRECRRTNKGYQVIKKRGYYGVTARTFLERKDIGDLIREIDGLMHTGQVLKDDHTCSVSRAKFRDKEIVIKKYNHKGLWHSLRHTIKRSRARRNWLHAHRLKMLNIATPSALGFVERWKWGLVWNSYLLTTYVEGKELRDFLRDESIAEKRFAEITGRVKQLLDRLEKHRIAHGDLKDTNILITESGAVLIDLDAMRAYRWGWTFGIRRRRDIARLKRNVPPTSWKYESWHQEAV